MSPTRLNFPGEEHRMKTPIKRACTVFVEMYQGPHDYENAGFAGTSLVFEDWYEG
jgi:hypothetical protein